MTAPAEPPRYVYKIVDTEPPFPIPDVFPPSELDRKDGFIHLSAPWQVSQPSPSTTCTGISTGTTAAITPFHPLAASSSHSKHPQRLGPPHALP